MREKMKLKKVEIAGICLAAVCLTFTVGFLSGRSGAGTGAVITPYEAPAPERETELLGRININTASAEELCLLPGIGETIAQRIVDDREENGPFGSPEELMRVSGIGAGKYAKVSDWITAE